MRKILLIIILAVVTGAVSAGNDRPQPIAVEDLPWVSPPGIPGVQIAWVLGSERQVGLYTLRVKLAKGARIPPHTHPDERNSTVLSGVLYAGFGERFADNNLIAIPAGDVYIAPAGVPHYLYAKEGDVIYQEAGYGPTGTQLK